MFGPTVPSTGPLNARIFVLAEAPGSEESARGTPLVGPSGWELRKMLNMVGLDIKDTYRANVFSRQPSGNNLHLYGTDDPAHQYRDLGALAANPITYLHRSHLHELQRLYDEITTVSPNLILALGNTATWALGLGIGISALRGSLHLTPEGLLPQRLKVLPTFHPSLVLRQWDQRTIVLNDLEKAVNASLTPDLNLDSALLWLEPTLADLEEFDRRYMGPARVCACDIETRRGQITCISFAPSPDVSLAIPFWVAGASPNYWPTPQAEGQAWGYVRRWLERRDLVKVFQNGLYDLQYLRAHCRPTNCSEDTLLAHHSLYSELNKGLGFLGSIYTNFASWKSMRTYKREEALKRDD